ncbi:MAG: hypothetical protein J6X44_08455 [Thermoguttaceae bacterium]|nr:hypothetical protein [Thermoguttaceae bacterium]
MTVTDDCCVVSWTRPDGKKGWALWSLRHEKEVDVTISGEVAQAFDYLGNDVDKPSGTCKLNLKPGILYLVGPESVVAK